MSPVTKQDLEKVRLIRLKLNEDELSLFMASALMSRFRAGAEKCNREATRNHREFLAMRDLLG